MNLDLDTLRTIVVAHDLGGFAQAADRLGRSASAISLQMKRLQEDVGAKLFRKKGRGVALTEAGEIVLRYGRRMLELNDELLGTVRGASLAGTVRIGVSQDFAETVLPEVLLQFMRLFPLVQVELRIEGNAALVDLLEKGDLDVALTIGQEARPSAEVLGDVQLVWIASKGFAMRESEPLPLVLLGAACIFRRRATEKLDEAGVPWRLAAVSPSLAGLWASASAGLGVTVRSAVAVPSGLVSGKSMHGLPTLGSLPVAIHVQKASSHSGIGALAEMVRASAAKHLALSKGFARTKKMRAVSEAA